MSLSTMSNISQLKPSLGPTNGRQAVGDGAFTTDMTPTVLAVCHMEGTDDMYYYSTMFSGGPGVCLLTRIYSPFYPDAVFSGGFDAPRVKCPPDRGSSDCVTGSPASMFSSHSFSDSEPDALQDSVCHSPTSPFDTRGYFSSSYPRSAPRPIPTKTSSFGDSTTPELSPDDGIISSPTNPGATLENKHSSDALDFLLTIFPKDGHRALQYSRSVSICSPGMGASFDGVVLELPGTPKTLYVDGKSAESVSLRESIVALLDLADEQLHCHALVIALERSSPFVGDLLHSLMYVGGAVVTKPPYQANPAHVLVGLEV